MTQTQADTQLANATKKFHDFLETQQGQEIKPERINSFFSEIRTVNTVYEQIKDLHTTSLETIKRIIGNLRGYLVYDNLVDVIFKTVIQLLSSISFVIPPKEEQFRDLFTEYFFKNTHKDSDSAINILLSSLGEIKAINPKFWWYFLCTHEIEEKNDPYLNRLKTFIDQFIKKPFKLITISNKNTVIYLIYQLENEQNLFNKFEIMKNSIFSSISISPKFVDDSKTLSTISVFNSESKDQTFQILHIIFNLGKEIFTKFLKLFALYINQLDPKKTACPSSDQQIDSLLASETWAYELFRLRYVLHISFSIVKDKQEFSLIFQNVISDLQNENLKILLIFAMQLDSHDNVIITANNSNPEYAKNVISFLGHLSVIFAPIFLKINEKEIISFSESCKKKNKRLKIFTKEAKFMEESSKICTDPIRLEKLLCEMESTKCLMHNNSPTLFLSLKNGPEWKYEEALDYVNSLIEAYSNYESELLNIFISRISVIQSFLINQGLGIDHHFLANYFFDRCIKEISVERIQTAFMIVESSSLIEDFSDNQREAWVQFLVKGFKSNSPSISEATSKVFLHCLTHLTTQSLCLIELFLNVNPNPSVDFLTTLTSIYSLCYNNESIDNRTIMMENILNHVKKFISELPRDEVTLGLLTTLLFEEITSEKCQKVSPGLIEAFDIFLSLDEQERGSANEPLEPLRMLSIFPNYYELIKSKYPTFFPQLIDCIIKIINNPKTNSNLFQLLVDTLVDTIILFDNSGLKFEEILKKINLINTLYSLEDSNANKKSENETKSDINLSRSDIEKCIILITAIDQFMARSNQPYKDLIDSKIPIPGSGKNINAQMGLNTGNQAVPKPGSIDTDKSNFCAYIINSRYSILKVLLDESEKLSENSDTNDPSISIYAKTMTGSYGFNVKLNRHISNPEEKELKEAKDFKKAVFEESQFNKKFASFADEYSTLDNENIKNFEDEILHSFDQDIAKDYGVGFTNKFEPSKPFEKSIIQPDPPQQISFDKDEGAEVLYPSCQATAFFESVVLDSSVSDKSNKKKNSCFSFNFEERQNSSKSSNSAQFSSPSSPTASSSPSSFASASSSSVQESGLNDDNKNSSVINVNNNNANEGGVGNNESSLMASSLNGIGSAGGAAAASLSTEDGKFQNSMQNDQKNDEEVDTAQLRLIMERKKKEKLLQKQISSTSLVIKNHFPLLDIATSNIFSSPIRETIKIGFLYVGKGQSDQNSILQNRWDQVSSEFRSFIASIGTIIDLSTHLGFSGKLDNTGFSNGRYQLYFSTDRLEVMYHVAPLLPTDPKDVQQIYKKRHIGNDNVHVVWSDHAFDYDATTITSQFNDAHIIIYPIHNVKEFFRVVIYKKSSDYHFGPLRGEAVVGAKALPDLVRWTSVFSDRVSRMKTSTSYKLPNQLLSDSIRDVLMQIQKK